MQTKSLLDILNKEMMLITQQERSNQIKLNNKEKLPLHRIIDQPQLDSDFKHITDKPMYTKVFNLLLSVITLYANNLLN